MRAGRPLELRVLRALFPVFSRQTEAPRIVTQPASQTVTEGQSVTFSVAATGTGPLTYQWRRNGSQIAGAAAATYTIPTAALTDTSSRYSVTITNEFGSVTSNDGILTVQAATKFFVVDSTSDRTYRYGSSGTFINSSAVGTNNLNAVGIASNPSGSTLWVIDSSKTVYVYNADMTLLGSWLPGGLRTPKGISVAGNDVWIVDAGTKRAHLFAGAVSRLSGTQNAARTVILDKNNTTPEDLVTDGTTLWVTQSGTVDRIFVYQAASGAAVGNWSIDTRNSSPVGITLDPSSASSSLWIVDNTTDTVYEYASSRSRTSGSQTAVRTFPLTTGNGNPQGIADPPPPVASATGHNSRAPAADSVADSRAGSHAARTTGVPVSPVQSSALTTRPLVSDRPATVNTRPAADDSQQNNSRRTRLPHARLERNAILHMAFASAPASTRETQTSSGLLDQLFADLTLPEQLAGI